MQNKIINGNAQAIILRQKVAQEVAQLTIKPRLAIIIIGTNPASIVYVNIKTRHAKDVGISVELHELDYNISNNILIELIQQLNVDNAVHGILVQMPLPSHITKDDILNTISPYKDVDGFSPYNVGQLYTQNPMFIPCTPLGILDLIRSVKSDLSGLRAGIIGRSNIVGRPVAELLLQHDCTVTIMHSKSHDIATISREQDILIVAVGMPKLVNKNYIKPGAIVIDVGISKTPSGNIIGDVDLDDVINIVGHISPVPGGVGPMTVAYLLHNTLRAAIALT